MTSETSTELISIVLPSYNGARYLRESIDSCLTQTDPNWELILVDDCSTDETSSIMDEYVRKDRRIRKITNPRNLKLPASLNAGFKNARGSLFTWTSDDNRYVPEALSELRKSLSDPSAADLVYSDFTQIDETGSVIGSYGVQDPKFLIDGNCVGACFLYRREVHEALGGYAEDLFLAEDYDFWLRAFGAGFRMKPLHKELYFYRYHSQSLTSAKQEQTRWVAELTLIRNIDRLTSLPKRDRIRGRLRLMKSGLVHKRPGIFARQFLQAVSEAPWVTLDLGLRKVLRLRSRI